MTARVTGTYQGDHARIKDAVNAAAETLDQSLQQVAVGADQIARRRPDRHRGPVPGPGHQPAGIQPGRSLQQSCKK
jgi:hypothetical protein